MKLNSISLFILFRWKCWKLCWKLNFLIGSPIIPCDYFFRLTNFLWAIKVYFRFKGKLDSLFYAIQNISSFYFLLESIAPSNPNIRIDSAKQANTCFPQPLKICCDSKKIFPERDASMFVARVPRGQEISCIVHINKFHMIWSSPLLEWSSEGNNCM